MTGGADADRMAEPVAAAGPRPAGGLAADSAALRRRLRRRCRARLGQWEHALCAPMDVRDWARMIAARRGRPILLRPAGMAGGHCGLWAASETVDYVFYERSTSPLHQTHIIFHELCHMICEHPPAPVEEGDLSALLFPSLDLDLARVRTILARTGYSDVEEYEAELQASVFVEAIERRICRREPTREVVSVPAEDGGDADADADERWLGTLRGPPQPSRRQPLDVAALRSWTSGRRALRRLYPLWRALRAAGLMSTLEPVGSAVEDALTLGDVRLRLYRRVIEIRDGLLAAHDGVPDSAAAVARRLAAEAGLSPPDTRVLVETAVLAVGILLGAEGLRPARTPPSAAAVHRGRAHLDAEAAFLVRLADCYCGWDPRCSPLLTRIRVSPGRLRAARETAGSAQPPHQNPSSV